MILFPLCALAFCPPWPVILLFGPLHFCCPLSPNYLFSPFWLGPWFLSNVSHVGHTGVNMCAGCPCADTGGVAAGPNKAGNCWLLAAVWLRVRLIWMCLLYLHTTFSQRCKNVTPIQISLRSAKCGQNWLVSWKFNRVRTDKQHYHINLISFRIQAKNMWWGFYSAIMCFKNCVEQCD